MRMKQLHTLVVGLFVSVVLAPCGLADIGLTLRNNGAQSREPAHYGDGGRAYLPPTAAAQDIPIKEEYIKIEKAPAPANQQHQQQEQTFQESNYGTAQYQIFEVHNQFQGPTAQTPYAGGPEYLPPHEEIHVQHANDGDDHLDLSILGITGGANEQIRIEHVHSSVAPPPATASALPATATTAIPVPFPSNYQHDFQKNDHKDERPSVAVNEVIHQHVEEQRPISYQGADNVAAQREEYAQYQHSQQQRGQNFDSHSAQGGALQQSSAVYKGPDYLPPVREQHNVVEEPTQSYPSSQVQQYQSNYKGPDYLPPHGESREPTYQQQEQPQSQPQLEQYSGSQATFKGPAYLPPNQRETQQLSTAVDSKEYQAPEYLPPGSSHVHHHVQQQIQSTVASPTVGSSNQYQGPTFLSQGYNFEIPVEKQQPKAHSQQLVGSTVATALAGGEYRSPGYLPPGYDFQNPEQPESQQQQQQQQDGFIVQHPLPQAAPQHDVTAIQGPPGTLPQGYDFVKPADAEQAIAQLHSLSPPQQQTFSNQQHQHDVVVQTQIQVAGRELHEDVVYGRQPKQQVQGASFQAPSGYSAQKETHRPYVQQQQQVQQQYYQQQQKQPYRAPAYLPPVGSQQQQYHQHMHSLSSYMTSVQPNQRYAQEPRKPFAEYGPPPQQQTPQIAPLIAVQPPQLQQPIELAPMYREQSTRPQHYAPTMSYTTAQRPTVSLSLAAKQSLQKFMPTEVLVQTPQSQPPTQVVTFPAPVVGATGKVRTVQIINSNVVKTLKVLETLDHTGVKTIKILGTSNESPMGDHHVVNVVTQSDHNPNEQRVQTVKIFNDQKDVTLSAVAGTVPTPAHSSIPTSHSTGSSNAYLPPFRSRVARQSWLRKHQQQSQGQLANHTGKGGRRERY